MSDRELIKQLEALFQETGQAHHEAFVESGGEDPEWPLWYAEHALEKLKELLNVSFTKSQLVYLLLTASNEQQVRAPGADWAWYYARFFQERYT